MKTATYYKVRQNKANGGHSILWFDKLPRAEKWVAENTGCEAIVPVPVVKFRGGFSPVEPSGLFGGRS